ncbi:hypothetical protein GOP47_0027730 [Adiantum capillus-veneris]|nr:hypothetical protein GOP47_0027730 [Adiantum capillus-veneris]
MDGLFVCQISGIMQDVSHLHDKRNRESFFRIPKGSMEYGSALLLACIWVVTENSMSSPGPPTPQWRALDQINSLFFVPQQAHRSLHHHCNSHIDIFCRV